MTKKNFDEFLLDLARGLHLSDTESLYLEIDKITKAVCTYMDVGRASVWLYGENNESIKSESLYILSDDKFERGSELFRKDFEPYFEAMENDRIIEADDARTHSATECFAKVYLEPLGIYSMYDTPIWKADKVIGVLCLEYLRPKESWNIEEKNFITSVADFLAKIYEKHSVLELIESLESKVKSRTIELEKTLENLRSTQKALIEKEKLASLGAVIAGVAHEIRNPLNHIMGSAEVICEMLDEENLNDVKEDLKEAAQIIIESSKRSEEIIRGMLEQSSDREEFSNINILEIINYALKLSLHNHTIDSGLRKIKTNIDVDQKLMVWGAKQKLIRVLINSFENSIHSLLKKSESDESFEPLIEVKAYEVSESVEIILKDNALGMDEGVLAKLFEPFYTTKAIGEGTGLGLSIAYDIVKGHKGEIRATSNVGEYTEISITLPIDKGE